MIDLIIIGGGAAGVFAAITAAQKEKVCILEKSDQLLAKVRLTGGGRCNLTNATFDIPTLAKHYPRGEQELLGPFHRFSPKETMDWFTSRGVPLKIESGGRVFPVSNRSESIIRCLEDELQKRGVEVRYRQTIQHIIREPEGFRVNDLRCRRLILSCGSSPDGYRWAQNFGHTIRPPIPSLFAFNVPNSPFKSISGVAIDAVTVSFRETSLREKGPLLFTHFGFSGPAILKLSSQAARYLFEKKYQADLCIHWQSDHYPKSFRKIMPVPTRSIYRINGKAPMHEFVTCGGVALSEVNFKTMESKLCPHLYFAGELLDIDGVTGGFNLQNAWTTGFIAGSNNLFTLTKS